ERGSDDDDVLHDQRGGVQSDITASRIDDLIVVQLEIDDAVLAEAGDAVPGFGVERDQLITLRDVEDPLLASVGPVRETSTGQLPRRRRRPRSFTFAVYPKLLASGRIQCDDSAPAAAGRVEDAVDHQRSAFVLKLRPRPQIVGLEAPGDLQLVEVAGVDLIER